FEDPNFLLSFRTEESQSTCNMTAETTIGPAMAPQPTSSIPMMYLGLCCLSSSLYLVSNGFRFLGRIRLQGCLCFRQDKLPELLSNATTKCIPCRCCTERVLRLSLYDQQDRSP